MGRLQQIFLAIALVSVGFGGGALTMRLVDQGQQQESYPPYTETATQGVGSRSATTQPRINGQTYKTPCQHPEGRDDSNLCAQWRSTEAAERSAHAADAQTLGNLLGVAAIAIGLIFSALAVGHAASAAEAAQDANRAWMEIEPIEATVRTGHHAEGLGVSFEFKAVNHGKSPAKFVRFWVVCVPVPFGEWIDFRECFAKLNQRFDQMARHDNGQIAFPGKELPHFQTAGMSRAQLDASLSPEAYPDHPGAFMMGLGVLYKTGNQYRRTLLSLQFAIPKGGYADFTEVKHAAFGADIRSEAT